MFDLREHLKLRGVTDDTSIRVDTDNNVVTFMLYDWNGKISGFQQYKPLASKKRLPNQKPSDMKYFSHAVKGGFAFWGAHSIDRKKSDIYVCEGIFDAIALQTINLNSIAVIGNNPSGLRNLVFTNTQYRFIPVCDGDSAGMKLAKFASHGRYVVMPDGTDPSTYIDDPKTLEHLVLYCYEQVERKNVNKR